MDVLVAGGAGFIGTNFIRYLLEKYPDYNVICIDKNNKNLRDIEDNERFRFYPIDICNLEEVFKVFKHWFGFDCIINFASDDKLVDTNIKIIFNFLEIIKKYKVKHVVQVSTNEIYNHYFDIYTATKASADLIALAGFHDFGASVVISRCSENFGSYQPIDKFIPSMIINALEGKKILAGDNIVNLLNTLDHCRALDTLMHYGKIGETYNINGKEIKTIDIAKIVLDYLGLSHDLIEKVFLKHNLFSIDSSKIRNEFNWEPILDFKESIIDTIEWYKNNKNWLNN